MAVPFIHLQPQHKSIRREVLKTLTRIADSQRFILGEYGSRLEQEMARYVGVPHAVGVASGSDALYLSLLALGVGPGDEVLTTPFTFFASAGSISRVGATPVFCDIDAKTFNLDVSGLEDRITSRTKAILPVHLFGLPCDMDAIQKIAKRHDLFVIEDAAQSLGARYKGKQTGSFGITGCFSFYPTKNLGAAGDGGMVVTRSAALAEKLRLLRNHGSRHKYHHEMIGVNSRLDEIQAAWVSIKLKRIDLWNTQRARHAAAYDQAFKNLPLQTPISTKGFDSNHHLYTLQCERRTELARHLDREGIGNGVYYPLPLHLQPCHRSLNYREGDLPVSEAVSQKVLSLPMYAELSSRDRDKVIRAVRKFFGQR